MNRYGLTQEERNADVEALIEQEQRHEREALGVVLFRGSASKGEATTTAERSVVSMITDQGLRVPQGFTVRGTLAGGHELVCSACGWTASLSPSGQGFTVVISDRGGDIGFQTRGRAAHAVDGVAVRHRETCGK